MEIFGSITIDNQTRVEGWDRPIPALSTWPNAPKLSQLTAEQLEFYEYLKQCIHDHKHINPSAIIPYLNLYAAELEKSYRYASGMARVNVYHDIVDFLSICTYPYYKLREIVTNARTLARTRRKNWLSNRKRATWIPLGQAADCDGHPTVRGGFYHGCCLRLTAFNTERRAFQKTEIAVEGPVVYPAAPEDKTAHPGLTYSTFTEMTMATRQQLLDWLAGSDTPEPHILLYYLSGLEFRLLADRSTTARERQQIIRYICQLIDSPLLQQDNMTDVRQQALQLVDFTLARFFYAEGEVEDLVPAALLDSLAILRRTRLLMRLDKHPATHSNINDVALELIECVTPPAALPEMFVETFLREVRLRFLFAFKSRMLEPEVESPLSTYTPIKSTDVYEPAPFILASLKRPPLECTSKKTAKTYALFSDCYQRTVNDLSRYLALLERGNASPMELAYALPYWIDRMAVPGIKELADSLIPDPQAQYAALLTDELLQKLAIPVTTDAPLDTYTLQRVRTRLSVLGLSLALPDVLRLRPTDHAVVYRSEGGEVPSRGVVLTCMILLAWVAQANECNDRDLAIIDAWIDAYTGSDKWGIAAKAMMRWLLRRKITMSAKRRAEGRQLMRFQNKRMELLHTILALLNSPDGISPKRMKRVETLYEIFDMDPSAIHSDLHRMALMPKAQAPANAKKPKAQAIDRSKLKEMAKSTKEAQRILAEVFQDEPTEQPKPETKQKRHSALDQILGQAIQRTQWTPQDFDALCRQYDMIAGAVLESLNDRAYDTVGEPVAEDDGDTITFDPGVAAQLLPH